MVCLASPFIDSKLLYLLPRSLWSKFDELKEIGCSTMMELVVKGG
jgi:hypothetical protein